MDAGLKPTPSQKFTGLLHNVCPMEVFLLMSMHKSVSVCYQSLAFHQSDLSPEVRDGHGDGFPVEAIWGIPHQPNPVSHHTFENQFLHRGQGCAPTFMRSCCGLGSNHKPCGVRVIYAGVFLPGIWSARDGFGRTVLLLGGVMGQPLGVVWQALGYQGETFY